MRDWRDLLEHLIYASVGQRRFTQDSPILPDVWIAFGLHPHRPQELLLTPTFDSTPGALAVALRERLEADRRSTYHRNFLAELEARGEASRLAEDHRIDVDDARVAYNQSTVAVRLWFHQLLRVVLPLSGWWRRLLDGGRTQDLAAKLGNAKARETLRASLARGLKSVASRGSATGQLKPRTLWLAQVAGTVALVTDHDARAELQAAFEREHAAAGLKLADEADWERNRERVVLLLEEWSRDPARITRALVNVLAGVRPAASDGTPELWNVNRNRPTTAAIYNSVQTVKADAATRLFEIDGGGIRWAIVDSGVDATHNAFRRRDASGKPAKKAFVKKRPAPRRGDKWDNHTRVVATYDFTRVRDLLAGDESVLEELSAAERKRVREEVLRDLKRGLQSGRMVDWELLEPVLRVPHDDRYVVPKVEHGTHVAGILAADWQAEDDPDDALAASPGGSDELARRRGMCPAIELYDLRVLDADGQGDEFSTMAALQFLRSINARKNHTEIHGVNVSLSIHHEVSNYACGRTPVCEECERLVGAGIVVVTAAGNSGRARYMTGKGELEDGYRSMSITDPGNAEGVITVGSTHRREPHTYGVSYFSSRGPTGDGRSKPDLVAPGEKIRSTFPGNREEYLDGTSMAAPHVSGAAALILCRHSELIGEPRRIKGVLCDTATDLGRERYFQGSGLLDVLRALQSI